MKPSRDPERTRRLILEAASYEIHRHGFQAASLKQILARTGLTKGALYHHFPNKQALGYAVVEELLQEMVDEDWLRPLEGASNPIDCLQQRLRDYSGTASDDDLLLGCPVNNLALEMSPVDEGFRLRVNRIYGKNVSVKGLDIGIANHCTGGISKGLQWGIVGFVEGDFVGWQDHFVNIVGGTFTGFQSGFYNDLDNGEAFQLGFINRARTVSGFQLGFINYTEGMYGLQIGLINFIQDKDKFPVLPLVNWSF